MRLLKSFIACFSTYSRIPMPVVELDSDDMKYALIFFPLIGAFIAVVEYGIFTIADAFALPRFVRTALMLVVPVVVTGGIHIDGYMDTMDAFSSYGDREKKLAIMKDPNTGAFAVIYLAVYGLMYMAFAYLINAKSITPMCYSFILSRIFSGISVVTIKGAKTTGMIANVKEKSENKTVRIVLIAMLIIVTTVLIPRHAFFAIASVVTLICLYFLYKRKCIKELNGITGDTSGYYLLIMELILLLIASVEGLI